MLHAAPVHTPSAEANIRWPRLLSVCLIATLGGLLFGYDTGVISGAIEPLTAKYHLSSAMKGWVSGCALLGCALGVLFVGPFSDAFGRKKAMFAAAFMFAISAIGCALPPSLNWFIFFRVLGGFGIGIASVTTPMYIAEVVPGSIRGRMVALNQIAIVGGIALIAFVNYFIAQGRDQAWLIETGWRWMLGSGLLPAVLFCILVFLLPESPRWLVEKQRDGEAEKILSGIGGTGFAAAEIANIRAALSHENGTWRELFSPLMLLPLVLGVLLAVLQQATGINVFLYFGATIFKNMSDSTGVDAGLLQQIIINGSCVLFTVVAIATVDRWGRKPLMYVGTTGMLLGLLGMGLMAQFTSNPAEHSGQMLALIILYIGCFGLSVGPVVWVILSEIYPTAIRGRALGLATFCLWVANYLVTQTFPMMDQSAFLVDKFHHAFPFYVYAGFCLILLAVMRFVPETKGKSLEEIEKLWK